MKLPNGFGTCYKLQGNRRRPYVVKKSIDGRQVTLGYFASYAEGLAMLFTLSTTDTMQTEIPFLAIYERWKKEHFPGLSHLSDTEICNPPLTM